jgi:hypothetical protein
MGRKTKEGGLDRKTPLQVTHEICGQLFRSEIRSPGFHQRCRMSSHDSSASIILPVARTKLFFLVDIRQSINYAAAALSEVEGAYEKDTDRFVAGNA